MDTGVAGGFHPKAWGLSRGRAHLSLRRPTGGIPTGRDGWEGSAGKGNGLSRGWESAEEQVSVPRRLKQGGTGEWEAEGLGTSSCVQWPCDSCEEGEQGSTAGVQTRGKEGNSDVLTMSSCFPNISNPANSCPKGEGASPLCR